MLPPHRKRCILSSDGRSLGPRARPRVAVYRFREGSPAVAFPPPIPLLNMLILQGKCGVSLSRPHIIHSSVFAPLSCVGGVIRYRFQTQRRVAQSPCLCLHLGSQQLKLFLQGVDVKIHFAIGQASGALLHKSGDGRVAPFPGQTHPTVSVTGMPRAVKPFRTATRIWDSAT